MFDKRSQDDDQSKTDKIISELNSQIMDGQVVKASSLISNKTIQKKYLKNNE